jgi:hypothetical protein
MLPLRPRRRRTTQSRERQASHPCRLGRRPRRRPGLRRRGLAPPCAKTEAALPGRSRAGVYAGRALSAESAAVLGDVACNAGEVEVIAVEDEAFENIRVGVRYWGGEVPVEDRSSIAPSE